MRVLNDREYDVVKRMRPTVDKTIPIQIGGDTVTWSGGGASLAATLEGVRVGDNVQATIQTAPTEAAYIKSVVVSAANTITITLSAANTSNDAVIALVIYR